MDNAAKHKAIARNIVEEVSQFFPNKNNLEVLPIIDEVNGHFMLYTDGWQKDSRDYGSVFHIQVKTDGKIYIRHDGTDLEIANLFIEKGVPHSEIVLAFRAPYRRSWGEFAVA